MRATKSAGRRLVILPVCRMTREAGIGGAANLLWSLELQTRVHFAEILCNAPCGFLHSRFEMGHKPPNLVRCKPGGHGPRCCAAAVVFLLSQGRPGPPSRSALFGMLPRFLPPNA